MTTEEVAAPRPGNEEPREQAIESILQGYCERGWKLLPIFEVAPDGRCSCGKDHQDGKGVGKHPYWPFAPNGKDNATSDFGIVQLWHSRRPSLNWGLVFDEHWALDIDPRNGFTLDDLDNWESLFGFELPPTLTQWSGGGGVHLIFEQVDGKRINNGKVVYNGRKIEGLDVKGNGGYILLAPSNHVSGRTYHWGNSLEPATPPADLLQMLANGGNAGSERTPVDVDAMFAGIKEGDRDEYLTRYIRRLRSLKLFYVEAYILVETACARMNPPFDMEAAVYKLNRCWDRFPEGTSFEATLTEDQLNFAKTALARWNRAD